VLDRRRKAVPSYGLHVYSSTITSQDWQGKRQPGTNRQMTAEDVVANHTVKHYLQTRRDVEYA
jgi:hypothetical protein